MDQSRSGTDQSPEERRHEERDPLRAGVTALCVELDALRPSDHEKLRVRAAVAALAAQARKADVPPERLLIVLKRLADTGGLAHLSFWHRLILSEQLVQWAIASYYQPDDR